MAVTIRVLLADDEAMVRAGVRAILGSDEAIEVVAEAADGQEAVDAAQRHRPDVAVLDIRMPRMDGLAAGAEIRRTVPGTAVVMLTTFSEDAYIAKALGDGASGFLLKSPARADRRSQGCCRGRGLLVAEDRTEGDRGARCRLGRRPDVAGRGCQGTGRSTQPARAGSPRAGRRRTVQRRDRPATVSGRGQVKAYVSAILTRLTVKNRVQAAIVAYEAGLVAD
jgi:DNA-binding NarL/FixJ family response regulator